MLASLGWQMAYMRENQSRKPMLKMSALGHNDSARHSAAVNGNRKHNERWFHLSPKLKHSTTGNVALTPVRWQQQSSHSETMEMNQKGPSLLRSKAKKSNALNCILTLIKINRLQAVQISLNTLYHVQILKDELIKMSPQASSMFASYPATFPLVRL